MRANSRCIACILNRQEKEIRQFSDEEKKSEYMHQVLGILHRYGQEESAPGLAERINGLYTDFWGQTKDFSLIKRKYNQLLLEREAQLEQKIRQAEDGLKECIKYVCAANYIDFSAVENVNVETFERLLAKAETETVPKEEYERFRKDLETANKLVYLTDNCGEIVLDKLFIRLLREAYPQLQITAVLRGSQVINDATMEDAHQVGLTEIVPCIGNGSAAPGTVLSRMGKAAIQLLREADVIISKGQGNFESLFGEGLNPYYFFLCKCDLFVERFGMGKFKSVFSKEERIGENTPARMKQP